MAFNSGSGTTTVTGAISTVNSVAIPSSDQTLITAVGAATGANQTAHTVTAGKIFYLFGYQMTSGANANGFIKDDGGTTIYYLKNIANEFSTLHGGGCPLASWAATENVIVNQSQGNWSIWGIEVDA